MSSEQPNPIVLIHGLWMSPLSWEHWAARFEARGLTVLAPPWPGMEGDAQQLRADTSAIDELGIGEILDSYEAKIREIGRPPAIMGHSFGAASSAVPLARGLGAAAVTM